MRAAVPRPRWAFLVGHWDKDTSQAGEQCDPCPHMDTPSIYRRLRDTPGCAEFGNRLKYQDGHTHCNYVQEADGATGEALGLMIGASGMDGCSQYGFEYVDSTGGQMRVWYFEMESAKGPSRSETVLSCIAARGLPNCTHLGTLWFAGNSTTGLPQ